MTDYQRAAKVLDLLSKRVPEAPTIDELAAHCSLSVTAFHRMFHRWVGTTPQAFLRCAYLERAKAALDSGNPVLQASLDAGLSGPGRLHDLCVALEGASPGEWKGAGADWILDIGSASTPFGEAVIANGPRGVVHLSFHDHPQEPEEALSIVRETWPKAQYRWTPEVAQRIVAQYFEPDAALHRNQPPIRVFVRGSAFRVRVWRALLRLPFGQVTTYGRLAKVIGSPKACRAVGTAVGSNPTSFLIPCHRVIQESGLIGNYRWAPERKRIMLSWERAASSPSVQ